MTTRVVGLPNGRQVTLGEYVRSWRALLDMDRDAQVAGFDYFADSAARILARLAEGLHDRINRHVPGYGVGRKWSDDWQRAAAQTARAVNTPRLIVRWIPKDLAARLSHRITKEDR